MLDQKIPTNDFSEEQLKIGVVIARNKILLKKIALGAFIFFDAVLLLSSIIGIGLFVWRTALFDAMLADMNKSYIDWPSVHESLTPRPLSVIEVRGVPFGGKTDFIATVINSNNRRWVTYLEYRFIWSSGSTDWFNSFIFPDDQKFLIALGADAKNPTGITLETRNIDWDFISENQRDLLEIASESLQITEVEIVSEPAPESGSTLSLVVFKIANEGPFDYKNIGYTVITRSGLIYRAINRLAVPELKSGAERRANVRWFNSNLLGSSATVELDLNFLDLDNFSN